LLVVAEESERKTLLSIWVGHNVMKAVLPRYFLFTLLRDKQPIKYGHPDFR